MNYYNERLNVNKLILWKDNARFAKKMETEEQCLNEIFGNKNMNKKQKVLLNDIYLETDILENMIVYKEEISKGKFRYIVLDGNRRLSFFKIIKYPELIKKYDIDFVKLQAINEKITTVDCKIYTNLDQAYRHVALRHLDEQDGKGTVKWASANKERMKEIQGKEIESIGFKILKFYESTTKPEFQKVKAQIRDKSTLDRIFGYKDTYNGKFGLNSKNDYDLYNPEHQQKINEVLEKFYNVGGKVTSVYTAKQTKELFSDVPSLPKNEQQTGFDFSAKNDNSEKNIITEETKDESDFNKSRKNQYTMKNVDLFNWTNKGIKSSNSLFSYYLKKVTKINSFLSNDKDFIMSLAPYLYRLLLDISIRDFTKCVNKEKAETFLQQDFPKERFNSAETVSCVTSNKIQGILHLFDKFRKNNHKELFANYRRTLNSFGFTVNNTKVIDKFVQDLNDVVHGSVQNLSPQLLEKYDSITLTLIQLIYEFINLE